MLAESGNALFSNLPLLFAVGVAIGFARKSDGSTALAAVVGYLIFDRVTRVVFASIPEGWSPEFQAVKARVVDADGAVVFTTPNPTGVLGGILVGVMAALLWQRYYRVKLPPYLAFFGGRRFVPIVTAAAAMLLGVVIGLRLAAGRVRSSTRWATGSPRPARSAPASTASRTVHCCPSVCTTSSTRWSGSRSRPARDVQGEPVT